MERGIRVFTEHFEGYLDRATDRVLAAEIGVYASIPRPALRALIGRAFATVKRDLDEGTTSAYPEYLSQVGKVRAQSGMPIGEMIAGLDIGFQVVSDHFKSIFGDDLAPRLWWEERRREIGYAGALAVTNAFYQAREAIIAGQHREIMELAAPIIPLHEGVLLMPIVGAITAERAAHIIEALLDGIARQRSHVAILDVTGLGAADETATDHLLRAARSARLLGTRVILVGISPALAVTFAKAGADLGGITVLADLTSGVEHALRLRGRAITRI
ncbi:MAG: STAS domain-containing protein [Byssovorax sp.]